MRIGNWIACMAVMGALAGCSQSSENPGASSTEQGNASSNGPGAGPSVAADNTGRNARDRDGSTLTPGDQGTSDADRQTTRRIRQALNSNDQLSTDAKNIKIITDNGKVTLRGPVKSREEVDAIQTVVKQAGVSAVDNQLEVATK